MERLGFRHSVGGAAVAGGPFRDLQFGFEVSEPAQNGFRGLGRNHAVFVGQDLRRFGRGEAGYRVLAIGADLSPEHLASNPFIRSAEVLSGRLEVLRGAFDWHPVRLEAGFYTMRPTVALAGGYTRTRIRGDGWEYDRREVVVGPQVRLQHRLFDVVFVEAPVVDVSFPLWSSRPAAGVFGTTRISYPAWVDVFLRVKVGVSVPLGKD